MPIKPRNPNNVRSVELGAAHEDHEHAHSDLTGVSADQHHAEEHSIASHNDTTATGAELETLTDGSDADSLHTHGDIDDHTHVEDDVTDLDHWDQADTEGVIDTYVDATFVEALTIDITEAQITDLDHYDDTDANAAIDARVDKAFVDALDIDADTLDGMDSTDFAEDTHTHTESDVTDLDHYDSSDFATDVASTDAADHGSGASSDGEVLTSDGAGGAAWEAPTGGGGNFDDFDLAADSGTAETVADGDTVTIAGGTGVDTSVAATDTVTVALDSATQASLGLADTATQPGDNVSTLTNDSGFITATLTQEEVEDYVGGMLTGNTETLITVTYEDGDGTIDFVVDDDLSNYDNVPGWIAGITGESLSDLSDVTITSIASDEILVWNGSAWINQTLAEAGISETGHTHTESDITDLDHDDTDAIHDNVAGEISALTLVTAADEDHILIEDASDANNKKRVTAEDFLAAGGGGTDDHGSLNGLGDDDHTQYLLIDGSRAMTGELAMGTNGIKLEGTDNIELWDAGPKGLVANDSGGTLESRFAYRTSPQQWVFEDDGSVSLLRVATGQGTTTRGIYADVGLDMGNNTIDNALVVDVNEIHADAGSSTDASYTFRGDQDTGMYAEGSNSLGFTTAGDLRMQIGTTNVNFGGTSGGTTGRASIAHNSTGSATSPVFTFTGDSDTGMYLASTNDLRLTTGGDFGLRITGSSAFLAPGVDDLTTASNENVHVSSSGWMRRSTSSLKYKPGWQFVDENELASLELPTPITWLVENEPTSPDPDSPTNTQLMLGFGAEHIKAMLPAATQDVGNDGEPENYDTRSLVAILSAKVKRLEKQNEALEERLSRLEKKIK